MPALSQDLTGPRSPVACQSCGMEDKQGCELPLGLPSPWAWTSPLVAWLECDDDDRPRYLFVILCRECSKKLIEPHPRLYIEQKPNAPIPGIMPLCLDCIHRDGVSCANPRAKMNGGEGLHLTYPKPTQVHFRRAKPYRSGWETIYRGPVTGCDKREVRS